MAKRTASARKAVRSSVGRTSRNRGVRSSVKTSVVRVRRAVVDQVEGLAELGLTAIANLDRAARKGILHRNNAGRRKSRLMKALNAAAKNEGGKAPSSAGAVKAGGRPAAKATSKATSKSTTAQAPAKAAAATEKAPAAPVRSAAKSAPKDAARPAPKASAVKAAAKKAAAKKPAGKKPAAKKAAPKKK